MSPRLLLLLGSFAALIGSFAESDYLHCGDSDAGACGQMQVVAGLAVFGVIGALIWLRRASVARRKALGVPSPAAMAAISDDAATAVAWINVVAILAVSLPPGFAPLVWKMLFGGARFAGYLVFITACVLAVRWLLPTALAMPLRGYRLELRANDTDAVLPMTWQRAWRLMGFWMTNDVVVKPSLKRIGKEARNLQAKLLLATPLEEFHVVAVPVGGVAHAESASDEKAALRRKLAALDARQEPARGAAAEDPELVALRKKVAAAEARLAGGGRREAQGSRGARAGRDEDLD